MAYYTDIKILTCNAHPELAKDVLKRFEESLSDIADVEIGAKLEGRSMFMQLTPKK